MIDRELAHSSIESEPRPKIYEKAGPKIQELLESPQERANTVQVRDGATFSERHGLEMLAQFIDSAISRAQEVGDEEHCRAAKLLKDNCVYIGDVELHEAIEHLAGYLIEITRRGKEVAMYVPSPEYDHKGSRSQEYVALLLFEALERQGFTSGYSPYISFFQRNWDVKSMLVRKEHNQHPLFVIPDDFMLSGMQAHYRISVILDQLIGCGIDPDEAASIIQPLFVSSRMGSASDGVFEGRANFDFQAKQFTVVKPVYGYAYYGVPDFPTGGAKGDKIWDVENYRDVCLTGSHRDPDFGYGVIMSALIKFGKKNGMKIPSDLPYNILPPYAQVRRENRENFEWGSLIATPLVIPAQTKDRWARIKKEYLAK